MKRIWHSNDYERRYVALCEKISSKVSIKKCIEEINSVVVKLDANSTSDLISKSLARFLGCKVKRENGQALENT